jgi:pyrroline-5-carboxylate reductase
MAPFPSSVPIIAVIGTGHMGTALIKGLRENGYPASAIIASDPSEEKLLSLQQEFHIKTTIYNQDAVQQAEVVLLAVKPQVIAEVTQDIAAVINAGHHLIISIAAGITEKSLAQWLGLNVPIIRCMPNTPALLRCGATALHANPYTSQAQRQIAETILSAVGITLWLDGEHELDAVTAVSGSGPAYFFLLIEAMQQAAQTLGLSESIARQLVLQTALGASRLAIENQTGVTQLRRQVTSPGGTTEAALQVLENENFRGLITKAIQAAEKRSKELAK